MKPISFKDILQSDIKETFFNISEFAEIHNLGGQDVPLIIDEDELKKRQLKAAEGTYLGEILIMVEEFNLKNRPEEGKTIKFDGKTYFVISCALISGIYEIAIGANVSW